MDLQIILYSLIFSAFFSGMEIAFVASNKLRIELDKKQGGVGSKIISFLSRNKERYIATMLVGNNIALVIYGMAMAVVLEPVITKYVTNEMSVLVIQTFISTIIILFTAEFLPKTIFRLKPNKSLKIFALPVFFFYMIFYPISQFTVFISNFLFRTILKVDVKNTEKKPVFGRVDLDDFIEVADSVDQQDDDLKQGLKIFRNALDFSKVKLRECIIPRNEIVAVDIDTPISELRNKFAETGLSKILVYDESIDNIIGYVPVLSMFKKPKSIKDILIDLIIVPETMPANKLFDRLIKEHKSIALVVDEFGGTAGMVTLEDIMEEIFGEIEDEHDKMDLEEEKISDYEYIFSGRLEIDYVNEKYNLNIPESEDYETIAGYILYHHEKIPDKYEVINIPPFKFVILKVEKPKIELVKLIINEKL